MLPASTRLRSSTDFRDTVRRGVRVARPTLVVHATRMRASGDSMTGTQVGFVVSKAVGKAATRNRVKRRLRHFARKELADTPKGLRIVVRALPAAASHPAQLRADLASGWAGGLRKLGLDDASRQGDERAHDAVTH